MGGTNIIAEDSQWYPETYPMWSVIALGDAKLPESNKEKVEICCYCCEKNYSCSHC